MMKNKLTLAKEHLDTLLADFLYNYDLPGLSVGIKKGDEDAIVLSHGYSNYKEKKPLTKDHIFHMASISKLFTGASVLKLANEGKFSLDDSLFSLLPWFSMKEDNDTGDAFKSITPRQILAHTSGLPDVTDYHWGKKEKADDALYKYCTSEDVRDRTLLWSPLDNKFSYSNIGYELLGTLIEENSGLSFEDYVASNFFVPLEMTGSTLKTYERTPNESLEIKDLEDVGLVVPFEKDADNNIVVCPNFPYHRGHGPSSTLTAPLVDVLKWGEAFFKPSALIKETIGDEKIWNPIAAITNSREHIGLSWFIREENNHSFYGHEGSDDGFRSSFWICPKEELAVVVCSNLSRAPVKKINRKVTELVLSI